MKFKNQMGGLLVSVLFWIVFLTPIISLSLITLSDQIMNSSIEQQKTILQKLADYGLSKAENEINTSSTCTTGFITSYISNYYIYNSCTSELNKDGDVDTRVYKVTSYACTYSTCPTALYEYGQGRQTKTKVIKK